MIRRLCFFVVILVASVATLACAPRLQWGQPVSMADYPTDGYLQTNMLTVQRRRFALPEGWHFQRRRDTDAERIKLWIHDTGGNKVTGAYGWEYVKVPISGPIAAERYADLTMKEFTQKSVQRTEIDGTESYLYQGVNEDHRWKRLSAVLFDTSGGEGTSLSDVTFLGDLATFDQDARTLYAILGTFKIMPRDLSERKIKGTFSFKCDDGALVWVDDESNKLIKKGFKVFGKVPNGSVILVVGQISTTRFADFLNMKLFSDEETSMTLRFAGGTYEARALHGDHPTKKNASTVYLFKHEGQDYMLEIFRGFDTSPGPVSAPMHEAPEILALLDRKFYFHR